MVYIKILSAIACLATSSYLIAKEYVIPAGVQIYNKIPRNQNNRKSSCPLLSGDTFRAICNHTIDETKIPFDPTKVKRNDTIFVNPHALDFFFSIIHPLIKNPYILVTHNSDLPVPGKFKPHLDDPKLTAWFGQNTDLIHPKVFAVPIGLANRYWPHGNHTIVQSLLPHVPYNKKRLLYMNFAINTNASERTKVYNFFKNKDFCYNAPKKPWPTYLEEMAQSKFVLSPTGNGIDCHRTWEALYMGAIPIVLSSTINELYEDLPVLVVNNWQEVTKELLLQKYEEFSRQQFCFDKLHADYWIEKIRHVQASR